MLLSEWYTKWKNQRKKKRMIKALRQAEVNYMKITRASVLAQMGHHRTPMEDIVEGLGVFRPKSRLRIYFRMFKLGWIMICLLWEGVISDDRGDYWINF